MIQTMEGQSDSFQVWKHLRDAKAKELEVKKQLNDMYQQKVQSRRSLLHCGDSSDSIVEFKAMRWSLSSYV